MEKMEATIAAEKEKEKDTFGNLGLEYPGLEFLKIFLRSPLYFLEPFLVGRDNFLRNDCKKIKKRRSPASFRAGGKVFRQTY